MKLKIRRFNNSNILLNFKAKQIQVCPLIFTAKECNNNQKTNKCNQTN